MTAAIIVCTVVALLAIGFVAAALRTLPPDADDDEAAALFDPKTGRVRRGLNERELLWLRRAGWLDLNQRDVAKLSRTNRHERRKSAARARRARRGTP